MTWPSPGETDPTAASCPDWPRRIYSHLDDWLLAPLKDAERRDLLEVIEDRYERGSTLIASQLPVTAWHGLIGDATLADAICDRLVHRAHKITLKGPSMREVRAKGKPEKTAEKPTEKKTKG